MVLLRDILSAPLFSNFRIVSGFNGINTPVTQVGFFEWESGADIERNFEKGEFIITTLTAMKDDPSRAEMCLRTLIRHQVSAIAIKDIYYKEISAQLKEFSNTWNVPILFFSDTFIDNIIFHIKTALLKEDSAMQERIVKSLLADPAPAPEQCEEYARKLNPFFEKQLLFCAYISVSDLTSAAPVRKALRFDTYGNFETRGAQAWQQSSGKDSLPPLKYSILPYRQGAFHICTTTDITAFEHDFPLKFVKSFFPDFGSDYRIGFCTEPGTLADLARSMKKAFFANITCTIDEISSLDFSETGMDQLLCPACSCSWSKQYYQKLLEKLSDAGDNLGVLISTMVTYTRCCGDVALTSKLSYQHSNTIRYRLQKIRKAWGINDALSFDAQMVMFCRLHHIYQLLEETMPS